MTCFVPPRMSFQKCLMVKYRCIKQRRLSTIVCSFSTHCTSSHYYPGLYFCPKAISNWMFVDWNRLNPNKTQVCTCVFILLALSKPSITTVIHCPQSIYHSQLPTHNILEYFLSIIFQHKFATVTVWCLMSSISS